MTIETDNDVAAALSEIALWYAGHPEPVNDAESGSGSSQANSRPPDSIHSYDSRSHGHGQGPKLLTRVAAVVLLLVAATAFWLGVTRDTDDVAATDSGSRPTSDAVRDLCLTSGAGYDLQQLREAGTIHTIGPGPDTSTGRQATVVISSGSVHVACGLGKREDTSWFQAVSLAGTHLPLASADAVDLLVTFELNGNTYIGGRLGSDVAAIVVTLPDGGETAATIDDGWWGTSFDSAGEPNVPFPQVIIRWTTIDQRSLSAPGSALAPSTPFSLCAEDDACRDERLVQLRELAIGNGSTDQAEILADGVVTEDEYRSALRRWGSCIAESTEAEVTFDDRGLFTIQGSGPDVEAAFESCKEIHVELLVEAVGLIGVGDG